jgi:hypothetical protein
MRRLTALGALLALMAMLLAAVPATVGGSSDRTILRSNVLVGVPLAYTGAKAPIRGVNGGGLPWVVRSGRVELEQGGSVEVRVRGLVIDPKDPTAIARGIAGTNPAAQFRVLVSCLTADGGTANVLSDPFAASAAGNAEAELRVALPDPCIAPILFVTSPAGAWFASTGG